MFRCDPLIGVANRRYFFERAAVEPQAVAEGDGTIVYTVSAGVATLATGDASAEAVLLRADDALYAAKRAGRNCTLRKSAD